MHPSEAKRKGAPRTPAGLCPTQSSIVFCRSVVLSFCRSVVLHCRYARNNNAMERREARRKARQPRQASSWIRSPRSSVVTSLNWANYIHTRTMLAAQTTTMGARPAFMGMRVTSINVQRSQGQGRVSMRIRAEDEAENKKQSAAKASPAALRYVTCFTAEGRPCGRHEKWRVSRRFRGRIRAGHSTLWISSVLATTATATATVVWRRSCGVAMMRSAGRSVGYTGFRSLTGSLLVHTRAGRSLPRRRPSRERLTG